MSTRTDLLRDFASRYIWWRDENPPSEDRVIAQVMSIGTWDDIRRLEVAYSRDELRGVMLRAQPGWISERSWELWRLSMNVPYIHGRASAQLPGGARSSIHTSRHCASLP
jgi:hypothetical protein